MKPQACPELTSMLLRAADGLLDEEETADLEVHLRDCRGCRSALAEQKAARRDLQARPVIAASPAFRVRVADAIAAEERSLANVLDFRRWTWRLAPVAAVLLTAIALGVPTASDTASADASDVDPTLNADLPVSSALYTGDLPSTSLESLLLVGNPDRPVGDYVQTQEPGK
ncbi:MAG: hypothetical protein R2752_16745 [Vicinamibacterales bacterium]